MEATYANGSLIGRSLDPCFFCGCDEVKLLRAISGCDEKHIVAECSEQTLTDQRKKGKIHGAEQQKSHAGFYYLTHL